MHLRCTLSFTVYWSGKIHLLDKWSMNNLWTIIHTTLNKWWCFIFKRGKVMTFCRKHVMFIWVNLTQLETDISESDSGRRSGFGQLSGGGWRLWGVEACVSHMIRDFGIHMDCYRQSKADWEQSLAVQCFCWSMTVRNLFRLLLWSFSAKTCEGRCQSSCLSESPCLSPTSVLRVSEVQGHVCVVLTHHVDAVAHKEKQIQLESWETCLTPETLLSFHH